MSGMNGRGRPVDRPDNSEKPSFYMQDDENTMKYYPVDMHLNKFFGGWS